MTDAGGTGSEHPARAEGRWPTFLVIGAGRCGTTTVHGLLRVHPRIFVPFLKEPNYFAMRALGIDFDELTESARIAWGTSVADEAEYRALFQPPPPPPAPPPAELPAALPGSEPAPETEPESADDAVSADADPVPEPDAAPHTATEDPAAETEGTADLAAPISPTPQPPPEPVAFGECSPVYMAVAGVAELIRGAIPDARLVALLRDPVERAISHHAHNVACGIDPEPDFEKALVADEAMGEHSNYLHHGRYAARLEPFFRLFGREQVLLIDYDSFAADPWAAMNRIFEHVGVEPLRAAPTDLRSLPTSPQQVGEKVRVRLAARFAEDTRRLVEEFGFEPARSWSSYPGDPASSACQGRSDAVPDEA